MYGLEIMQMLKLRGVKIGVNQLYPALHRLQEKDALKSTAVERVGATRIYYKTTEHGKQLAIHQYLDFGELIQEAAISKLAFIPEDLQKIIEIKNGCKLLDFSGRFYNLFIKMIATKIGPGGQYLVYSQSKEESEIFQHRLDYYSLTNVRVVEEKLPHVLNIAEDSIDLGISYLNIRTVDRVWRLRELARLLKPEGKAVFIDWHQPRENVRMEIMSNIFPGSIGIKPEQFRGWLEESGFCQIEIVEERGLLFITASPV
jgi:SAM-dependent methyltransferase